MQRVKQRVSVLDILNLHMSSNSYKRWNLRLQPHSTKQLLLLHNYQYSKWKSLSASDLHFWCWMSFQKGLRPDRPTQPETWRSSEALQECKKNQQQIVPLQPEVKVGCRRGCAQHVTTIMPTQKLTKLQIFEENFSTNLWKSFLVLIQTTCLIQNRGSKPHVVSPKTALLRANTNI